MSKVVVVYTPVCECTSSYWIVIAIVYHQTKIWTLICGWQFTTIPKFDLATREKMAVDPINALTLLLQMEVKHFNAKKKRHGIGMRSWHLTVINWARKHLKTLTLASIRSTLSNRVTMMSSGSAVCQSWLQPTNTNAFSRQLRRKAQHSVDVLVAIPKRKEYLVITWWQ